MAPFGMAAGSFSPAKTKDSTIETHGDSGGPDLGTQPHKSPTTRMNRRRHSIVSGSDDSKQWREPFSYAGQDYSAGGRLATRGDSHAVILGRL